MAQRLPRATIAIRFHGIDELFDGKDPAPIAERDLDADAEEFIVGWARELGRGREFEVVVVLPEDQRARDPERIVGPAIHRYFKDRAEILRLDLKGFLRQARLTLLIGVAFLVTCMAVRELIRTHSEHPEGSLARIFEEGLLIIGWVATWRPLELLLYDWWPLVVKRWTYEKLASVPVAVRYAP